MPQPIFKSASELARMIDTYFLYIEGEFLQAAAEMDSEAAKKNTECIREPEPPTVSGLAWHLNFNSRQDFYDYEDNGIFADVLKRGRLRIEMTYETKLHHQSSTGAIFALKSMGWNEKPDVKPAKSSSDCFQVTIFEIDPAPVGKESDVSLD